MRGDIAAALRLPAGPRFIAGVDGLAQTRLRGWAVDLTDVREPVELALTSKGRRLASLATCEYRPDIGAVMVGNVAGFALDLAALEPEAAAALREALSQVDPAAIPTCDVMSLVVEADGSPIDLDAFGVTAGALLEALGPPPPAPEPEASPPQPALARPEPAPAPPRLGPEARALHWLLGHFGAEAAPGARHARRFAEKLAADIERSAIVSEPLKRHARTIAPLFDPFHYLDQSPAPEEALANPLLHYVQAGWRDGLSPCPLFAPDFYKDRRGAVAGDPLLDFLTQGAAQDVDPHPLFSVAHYRAYLSEAEAGTNPLTHYLDVGGARRLDPCALFNSQSFLDRFQLGAQTANPLETFVTTPAYFDFPLIAGFDAALYRHQIEVERAGRLGEPGLVHYLARGWRDPTLLPNLLFDPEFYVTRNKLELREPALIHYLREGEPAGLACHPHFSPAFYNAERGVATPQGALEHALAHPGLVRSDPRMEAPIDPRLFDLVRDLLAERGDDRFRLDVYRQFNIDMAEASDDAAEAHYREHGDAEGRVASLTRMMRLTNQTVRDLPLGFVLADYVRIYPDLAGLSDKFLYALFHYGRHGRQEKRLIGKWLFRIDGLRLGKPSAAAPLKIERSAERVDVCILIHAFYADLLGELAGFAQNFRDVSFDIFINVVDLSWTPEVQEELRAICPGAFVLLSNDSGRDIGGFTRLLSHVDIARYDVFALLHSKKSPHVAAEKGEYWRRSLLMAFAGSPEIARECVETFKRNALVGLIGAKEWRSQDMGKNVEHYERLLDLLGVRGRNRELDYVSGFMFLVRSDVVARLYEVLRRLDFEYGGDKDLEFHMDGQIAHGVERAVPALVRHMGYDVLYR